jgi:hypothetical protein
VKAVKEQVRPVMSGYLKSGEPVKAWCQGLKALRVSPPAAKPLFQILARDLVKRCRRRLNIESKALRLSKKWFVKAVESQRSDQIGWYKKDVLLLHPRMPGKKPVRLKTLLPVARWGWNQVTLRLELPHPEARPVAFRFRWWEESSPDQEFFGMLRLEPGSVHRVRFPVRRPTRAPSDRSTLIIECETAEGAPDHHHCSTLISGVDLRWRPLQGEFHIK